jgi:hypothetical protein
MKRIAMKPIISTLFLSMLSLFAGTHKKPLEATGMAPQAERLRLVFSKVAPLERWDSSLSHYGPKICFEFFRPDPTMSAALLDVINNFRGRMKWTNTGCLEFEGGKSDFPNDRAMIPAAPSAVLLPSPNPEEAWEDVMALSDQIERQLRLADKKPQLFLPAMLTWEGLRQSHGPYQDFWDGGQLTVYLIVHPTAEETVSPNKEDILLHFGPGNKEITAVFNEILGTDLTLGHGRSMTDEEIELIKKRFPVFWEMSDYDSNSYLSPDKARLLYDECEALHNVVSSPKALRGVEKLMRIGYWASTKRYGVFFEAP